MRKASTQPITESERKSLITRRGLLLGGIGGGVAAIFGDKIAASASSTAAPLTEVYRDPASSISVSYAAAWSLDRVMNPGLVFPYQCFAIGSKGLVGSWSDFEPELDTYDKSGIVLWITRDGAIDYLQGTAPPDQMSLNDLVNSESSTTDFSFYLNAYNGKADTFAIYVWVGPQASAGDISTLQSSLASISIP